MGLLFVFRERRLFGQRLGVDVGGCIEALDCETDQYCRSRSRAADGVGVRPKALQLCHIQLKSRNRSRQPPSANAKDGATTMPDFIDKYGTRLTFGLAAVLGPAVGLLQLSGSVFVVGAAAITALALLVWYRSERKLKDPGAWQRQIDREYRLSIDGTNVTLYRNQTVTTQFRWHGLFEVQLVSRYKAFPPSFWKLTTTDGDFFIPNGGRYAREFEKQLIYALPGYYEQRSVTVPAPKGYERAHSMWRKDDPHPKQEVNSDWEW